MYNISASASVDPTYLQRLKAVDEPSSIGGFHTHVFVPPLESSSIKTFPAVVVLQSSMMQSPNAINGLVSTNNSILSLPERREDVLDPMECDLPREQTFLIEVRTQACQLWDEIRNSSDFNAKKELRIKLAEDISMFFDEDSFGSLKQEELELLEEIQEIFSVEAEENFKASLYGSLRFREISFNEDEFDRVRELIGIISRSDADFSFQGPNKENIRFLKTCIESLSVGYVEAIDAEIRRTIEDQTRVWDVLKSHTKIQPEGPAGVRIKTRLDQLIAIQKAFKNDPEISKIDFKVLAEVFSRLPGRAIKNVDGSIVRLPVKEDNGFLGQYKNFYNIFIKLNDINRNSMQSQELNVNDCYKQCLLELLEIREKVLNGIDLDPRGDEKSFELLSNFLDKRYNLKYNPGVVESKGNVKFI